MRKFLVFFAATLAFASCQEDKPDNLEPQLYIGTATDITRTEATLAGNIVTQGGTPMPELRFVYGKQSDMSLVSQSVEADGQGHVAVRLTGLEAGTPYSFYLQCSNGRVTLASDTAAFTTLPNEEPRLYADAATDITRTEATLAGSIVIQDDLPMPELRFVYGPQDEMSLTSPGVEADDEGRVSVRLTGLEAGTSYSFCMEGFYDGENTPLASDTLSFTTLPDELPAMGHPTLVSLGPASAIVNYEILSEGSEPVTETGCYVRKLPSGNATKVQAPSTTSFLGLCQLHISGLERNSAYQIQPYATSKAGETKGETLEITTSDAATWDEPGGLAALMGDDLYRFTSLAFDGPMNGDDLRLLRQMMGRDTDVSATPGRLVRVNLSDADIVDGGESYDNAHYAKADVVGQGLFAGCDKLASVTLPNSATTIEKNAFLGCSSLTRLDIPPYAEEVTPSDGCERLAGIHISAANPHYRSEDGVLFTADLSQIVWFPVGKSGDYTMPASVTSLGDYAFQGCHITRFTLPEGLKELGQYVFYGSTVEEVVTPASLRTIPTATFQGCRQLTTVRLGSGTELVSDYAFGNCPLEHLYVEAVYPPVCNPDAFSTSQGNLFRTCTLHVPANSMDRYKAHPSWGQFEHIMEIE